MADMLFGMRCELSDREWSVIKSMLPNKPRGIPRVDDRRALAGNFPQHERSRSLSGPQDALPLVVLEASADPLAADVQTAPEFGNCCNRCRLGNPRNRFYFSEPALT